jgi:GNAT superfamily N-acetyltransferase
VSLAVRLATEEDSGGIRQLFSRAFGREMSEAEWRWKYPDNPDGWKAAIALSEGEVVGHFGASLAQALIAGTTRRVALLGDVATDPSARSLGRASALGGMAETLFAELDRGDCPFGFGFPSPRHLKIGERLGYRERFPIIELRFPLEPGIDSARSWSDHAGPEFDALWETCRLSLSGGCLTRDGRRVNWRFHARPGRYYRMVTPSDGSGWGCLWVVDTVATVVDFLPVPPAQESLPRLHAALAAEAFSMGARELRYWNPPGGPAAVPLARLASESAAIRQPSGFSFVTAVVFDEEALSSFLYDLHLVPSFYDER